VPPESGAAASFRTVLPLAGLRVVRSVAFAGQTLLLTTSVERGAEADALSASPVEWCEHTTLGPPFLDGVEITASVDGAWAMPAAGADAAAVDAPAALAVAAALRMPRPEEAPTGSVSTARVVAARDASLPGRGVWRAVNSSLGWELRAEWDVAAFPWLCLWTEHCSRSHAPWASVTRSRGMELSTKPFPEGAPPASRAASFQGAPACFSVPAGSPAVRKTVALQWQRLVEQGQK
jgi:hypothetical protein